MKKSQIAMICGLLVVILGSPASVNATLTPIGPFNGLWSESFDSMPHGDANALSIMGGNAKISIPGDALYAGGGKLYCMIHMFNVVLDFVTPVDAFGAYMSVDPDLILDHEAVDDEAEYRSSIGVRFFDSGWNRVGDFEVSTPLPGLWWYGYVSSVPFQSVEFGQRGSEAHWLIMDDLQAGRPIPEPFTWLLLGSGLIGLAGYGKKKFFKETMKKILFGLLSLVLAVLPGMALSTQLVTNGGFETGNLSGWTQSGNTGFTQADIGNAHSGTYAAESGPARSLGFISQNLTTVPGGNYDLTFWLHNRNSGTPNEYQVYWGAVQLTDIINSSAFDYTEISFLYINAPSSSTELRFGFRHDPSWFDLDDVSVTGPVVPEPATMLLLGSGLLGLVGYGRKKFFKK